MKQTVRHLALERESRRDRLIRDLIAGAAEALGALCIVIAIALATWGAK